MKYKTNGIYITLRLGKKREKILDDNRNALAELQIRNLTVDRRIMQKS